MSRKKNSILFYGIYSLSGILLLISVLVTGTYGLRKENVEVYETADALQPEMDKMQFPGFKLEDYPVRFYDGDSDYVITGTKQPDGTKLKKESPVFQTYVGTITKVDGSWQVVVPVLEQFSQFMDLMADAGTLMEGGLAAGYEKDAYGQEEHAATIWHEAFHAYQMTNYEEAVDGLVKEELPEETGMGGIITSKVDQDSSQVSGIKKELEHLKKIYATEEPVEKKKQIAQYLELESSRKSRLSDTARWVEQYYETVEGTACFVEGYAYGVQKGAKAFEKHYIQNCEYSRGSGKYYYSGMLKCCILDQVCPGWEKSYDFTCTLDDLLEQYTNSR